MILLDNGRFYVPDHPEITAMLIDRGKICAMGNKADDISLQGEVTHKYDLKNSVVWPGFTDAHIHLASYGLNLLTVNCETAGLQECLNRVDRAATQAALHAWVTGHGWNQNSWSEGYGTATQLDACSHDHPVFLTAKSLHAAWANTHAMQLAGIHAQTPDPAGGRIVRDACGNPTGIFLESAMDLITSIIPKRSGEELEHAILDGMKSLNRMGITCVHDFDALDRLDQYQQLEANETLTLRILKAIPPDDHQKALDSGFHSGTGSSLVQMGPFKFFMDGALGPHTAAMFDPYEDDPTNCGILNHTSEEVVRRCGTILKHGSDLSIHAIGDRANHEALQAFADIRRQEADNRQNPRNLRIEHVQLLHPQDLMAFKQYDISASMQPLHATSDMGMADAFWGERKQLAYAWKSLEQCGARLVFGSDAPVESPNPFLGLHAAVTRQRPDGSPSTNGWIPNQRIALRSALNAYTTHPAQAGKFKAVSGKLEPGSPADLMLLLQDPFLEKAQELHHIKPVATMFNGQWVWVDSGYDL